MKHDALTEEEIAKAALLPEGTYDFTIIEVNEYVSDKGNATFKIKHNIFEPEGKTRVIYDWVTPAWPKKFKHLHDACGLIDLYNSKQAKPEDFVDKSGKLILGVGEPYKDKNGLDRINNSVVDYVKRDNAETYKNAATKAAEDLNDEVPF